MQVVLEALMVEQPLVPPVEPHHIRTLGVQVQLKLQQL